MKRFLLFSFTLLTSTLFAQNLQEGLILHYPIENNIADISGNAFHGDMHCDFGFDRFGNANQALKFNGVNQYVDFPNDPALKPDFPITIAFWVRYDDADATNTTFFATDFVHDRHSGVWVNLSSTGKLALSYGDAEWGCYSSNRKTKLLDFRLSPQTWYHITAIWNGVEDMEAYINFNHVVGTYHGTGSYLAYTDQAGSLGRKDANNHLPPYYFLGLLDDFRYWNKALTEEEIEILEMESFPTNNLNVIKDISLEVYPNPATNTLFWKASESLNIDYISIMNVLGKTISHIRAKDKSIDISLLTPGIYFLHLKDINGTLHTEPFIKK